MQQSLNNVLFSILKKELLIFTRRFLNKTEKKTKQSKKTGLFSNVEFTPLAFLCEQPHMFS